MVDLAMDVDSPTSPNNGRPAYIPPADVTGGVGGAGAGGAVGMDDARYKDTRMALYVCNDCGLNNHPTNQIVCSICGSRVLLKARKIKGVQYDAR